MALEQPSYRVLKTLDGIEYRDYEPYKIAVCRLENLDDLNRASSQGFRYLFNYISGENQSRQKVAMTVPVIQKPADAGWSISFVVPKSFYATGAPEPSNSMVKIDDVAGGRVAALRYRGFWNSDRFDEKRSELLEKLREQGTETIGDAFSAVYNPPMTPPFLRRNEVLIRLDN